MIPRESKSLRDLYGTCRRQGYGRAYALRFVVRWRRGYWCRYCLNRRQTGPDMFCCGMTEDDYWRERLLANRASAEAQR